MAKHATREWLSARQSCYLLVQFTDLPITRSFSDRSGVTHQRDEKFPRLLGHRHMSRMFEPNELLFRRSHLVEPGGGDLRIYIHVVTTFEQDQRDRELADLAKIGRD